MATGCRVPPTKVVAEVGSGLNGHRGTIVVAHCDGLARFGGGYLEAAVAAQGRRVVVVEEAEVADDLVGDVVEVLTCFCVRLYGRRSAMRRAEAAMVATGAQVVG